MSATVSPASESGHAAKADDNKSNQDQILHIDMKEGTGSGIVYGFISLAGDCALDQPFWHSLTLLSTDVRGLGAMTVRFISNEEHSTTSVPCRADANRIRRGVWLALEKLLSEHQPSDFLPRVLFNQAPLDGFGRRDIIDLVFPLSLSPTSYNRILRSFLKLTLQGEGVEPQNYSVVGATNTLPGSILAFDCHGLPIEDLEQQSVFEALKGLTASAGVLLGFGKVVLTSEKRGISDQYGGFIRGFIKLHQDKVRVPFHDFRRLLPTHFTGNSMAYSLSYVGSKLRNENVFSNNSTVALAKEAKVNGTVKHGSAVMDEAESSSAAKKKRGSQK